MAEFDSDDEETFVTIGTALELLDEDELPKKPLAVHEQKVRDSRGRQRFHGAFTGGFSAGYFNTVGSKEGFTPSTFVSSRSKDGEKTLSKKPEDYMDDEDFDAHGIAPKSLQTTHMFGSVSEDRKRKIVGDGGIIPGQAPLADVLIPAKISVGVKLLRKLGWKDGQGVGARVRKKIKMAPSQRIIGCTLPPGSESENSDDDYAQGLTFAPKDVTPISFDPKDDLHGIGYRGIDPTSALISGPSACSGHINLFGDLGDTGRKKAEKKADNIRRRGEKKGMTGKAFGVGGLEDEDDEDIYSMDSMSNYDQTTEIVDHDTHGWTAPKFRGTSQKAIGYISHMLEGFKLSSKAGQPKKVFPPPVLPRDFKPIHVFKKPAEVTSKKSQDSEVKGREAYNARSRATVLGEKPVIRSVFDLISKDDKTKMDLAKQQPPPASTRVEDLPGFKSFSLPKQSLPLSTNRLAQAEVVSSERSSRFSSAPTFQASGKFQPFAKDPAKQKRYEHYLEVSKKGQQYVADESLASHMTEWERQREKEEFQRAAMLYRPLSDVMAFRFTTAKHSDDADMVEVAAETGGDKNDQQKAAEMKMFGKLTHDVIEWHPDKRLAKRFNVPNPYPDSAVVGTLKVKRDKFSVFNFLNVPGEVEQNMREEQKPVDENLKAITSREYVEREPEKPLASAELTKDDQTADSSNKQEEEKSENRPPMDLFKAIFQNSSSSESSSEDEDEKTDSVAMEIQTEDSNSKKDQTINSTSQDQALLSTSSKQLVSIDQSSLVFKEDKLERMDTQPAAKVQHVEERLHSSPAEVEQSDEVYFGPVLPPVVSNTQGKPGSSDYIKLNDESSSHLKDRKREKHKHKHKSKKKKQKHKKSKKHKKKKSKKSKKSSSSESADNEWDTDSSDDSDPPTKQQPSQQSKTVPSNKRLTAADFW